MADMASLILRLGLGLIFLAHGSQKVFGMFGGPGIKGFSEMLSGMGFSPALSWAYIAAYSELIGGLCVLLGLGTRIGALLLTAVLAVALVKVHLSKGLFLSNGGFEYVLVLLCMSTAVLLLGAGKYSIIQNL